ncbi:MAG: glycosyltransferase family 4 protein, partial [Candidatus Saccharimonadales bacterium]
GPQRRQLERTMQQLELENVHFVGYVSEQRKINLLRSADLFCSPAVFGESFGIVLLEAMASGLPLVAGNNSGYATVMQGLGSLSLANPRNVEEFAGRIDMMLHENQLRDLWRQWAKQTVQSYNYPKIIDQYEAVYARAVQNHIQSGRQISLSLSGRSRERRIGNG